MKSAKFCLLIFMYMFLGDSLLVAQDSYELLRTVNLHNLSANDYLNCLKTQAVALNPLTKKVYVTGILSNDASIIDLETNQVVGSIPLPKDGFQLMSLFCDPELNRLFAYTQSSDGDQPTTLYAIDLSDNSIVDTYDFGEVVCAFIPDTIHHRIYCTFNNKTLISFNSMSFTDKQEIQLNYKGVMGHIHPNGDTLYLASQNAGGKAKFSVYHLPEFSYIRDMGLPHNSSLGEMGEVFVLPEYDRVVMSGLLSLEIGNLAGDSLAYFDWNGDYSTDESHGPEYDPVTQKFYITQKAGYEYEGIGGRFSKLIVVDPINLKEYHTKIGLGSSQLVVSENPHRLVITHMEDGNVWIMNLDNMVLEGDSAIFTATTIVDVASSVENFVYDPNRDDLYISNRLGNNSLSKYNFNKGILDDFFAGNWPVNVQIDPKLNRLFAYSHFESSFYVFNLPDLKSPQKIRLSIPEARTDQLDDMVIDTVAKQLYVVIPESGVIGILNTQTLELLPTLSIPGFVPNDSYGGPHALQLAYSQTPNRLYCMDIITCKLYEFGRDNNFAFIRVVDLLSKVNKTKLTSNWHSVNFIPELGLLALANSFYDPIVTDITKTLAAVDVYIATSSDKSKMYFGKFETDKTVKVLEFNPSPLGILREKILYKDGFYEPTFLYIPGKEWLVLGDLISTNIRIYNLLADAPVNVLNDLNTLPADFVLFQNYPNPFNPVTKIKFTIPTLTSFLSPRERMSEGQVRVMLKVYDILGNEVSTLINEEQSAGEYEVEMDGSKLASGIYFYILKVGNQRLGKKMCLIK